MFDIVCLSLAYLSSLVSNNVFLLFLLACNPVNSASRAVKKKLTNNNSILWFKNDIYKSLRIPAVLHTFLNFSLCYSESHDQLSFCSLLVDSDNLNSRFGNQ